MSYIVHNFQNDSPPYLNKTVLDEMDNGIYAAHNDAVSDRNVTGSTLTTGVDSTFTATETNTLAVWVRKIVQKLVYIRNLCNSYSPTTHVHGNVTAAGAIGTASGKIIVTGSNGTMATAAYATIAQGGTGAQTKLDAKSNLGITYGTADPSGGSSGDIYFKYVS